MKPLTDVQIQRMLQDRRFGGVINKDDLDRLDRKCYVANLDSEKGPGTHWVALSNMNPLYCYYFDSFGCPPPEHLLKLMNATHKRVIWNKKVIQSLATDSCGEFCVMFLQLLMKEMTPPEILGRFHGPKQSESILKKYYIASGYIHDV